jgi:zinc transporter
MNVGGVPLADDKEGFWIIAAIVAIFTLVAGYWALRKERD